MGEQGPGYLANLIFLWLITSLGLIAIHTIVSQIGHPVGFILGFAVGVVVMFAALYLYYRVFLDERPFL